MRKVIVIILAVAVLAVGATIGGYFIWDKTSRISAAELEMIVARDGVLIPSESMPEEVLERLAANRVVVLGEQHFLREHRELEVELIHELYSRGFRQYLFEWSQAVDWLLADYVNGGGLAPDFVPPHDIGGVLLTAIRDFNATLPAGERIEVHGLDVHLPDYGGTDSWVHILSLLADLLPGPGPIEDFLAGDHSTFESHQALLEQLQQELLADREGLVTLWGDDWYETVTEMVEVELLSVQVRSIRDSDYEESVRLREEAIKLLADRRIGGNPGGTIVNFGVTHSQKKGAWGTKGIEWLGDYLVHRSPVAQGSTIVIWVAAAQVVDAQDDEASIFELSASPDNELLRVISEVWPEERVFLPMDDPLFLSGRIPLNVSGDVYVTAPARQFDAVILLPLAHRDRVGD